MTGVTGTNNAATSFGALATAGNPAVTTPDPNALAKKILGETGGHGMKYDRLGQIEARLDSIGRTDPQLAANVRR